MAITHSPGTGIGPGDAGRRGRRAAVLAAVVLACAAIVVPTGLRGLDRDRSAPSDSSTGTAGQRASSGPTAGPSTGPAADTQATLGPQGDLPPLLAAGSGLRTGLRDGARVLVGDITDGWIRRAPGSGWRVVVRWDGRWQALPTHGPVSLNADSWVSAAGFLYTRVPTGTPGRFRVYAWDPQGGSAYTPPTLVASRLGLVCFNRTFSAFGNCRTKS